MKKLCLTLTFLVVWCGVCLPDTKPPLGSQINWAHPLSEGLVGCWLFNEGHGDVVYDISGNNYHGTIWSISHPSSPSSGWNPGKNGPVIAFDYTNDYIEIADSPELRTTHVSVRAVLLSHRLDEDYMTVVCKEKNETVLNFAGWRLSFDYQNNDKITFVVDTHNNIDYQVLSGAVTTNTWYDAVGVWDGTNLSLYVDGVLAASKTVANVDVFNNTDTVRIGRSNGSWEDYFDGLISEVSVWDRGLTANEVQQLFLDQYQIFDFPNLALFYQEAITSRVVIIQ